MEIEMLKTLIILIMPPSPSPPSFICWPTTIYSGIFLINCTFYLLLVRYHYLFTKSIWLECRLWTTLLNHKQLFDVSQNLLGRALKNKFSPSSLFFPFDTVLSTLNNQGISCFNKNNWYVFVMFITCALFNVVWLDSF